MWKGAEKCQKVWESAETILPFGCCPSVSRATKRGGFQTAGVSGSGLVLPFLSFFVLSQSFGDFADLSGTLRGFSQFVLFRFLGLLTAPTRNSPERVRDTIWTFPEKSGKPPGLETPRLSCSQCTASQQNLNFVAVKTRDFLAIKSR